MIKLAFVGFETGKVTSAYGGCTEKPPPAHRIANSKTDQIFEWTTETNEAIVHSELPLLP
jgi:hypothetical protein